MVKPALNSIITCVLMSAFLEFNGTSFGHVVGQVSVRRSYEVRPVRAGTSVGLLEDKAVTGRIGCVVRDKGGTAYILTAERVLNGTAGALVVQPSVRDGGTKREVIGRVARRIPGVGVLATLTVPASPALGFLGRPSPVTGHVNVGEAVAVFGSDEPYMGGGVERVPDPGASGRANRILVGGDFVQADAGAPVINDRNEFVGFVAEVSEGIVRVIPAADVLKAFDVELAQTPMRPRAQ